MSDLSTMKARIQSELRRTDLTTRIANAINTAIGEIEADRFYFNETRDITFPTVAAREFYTSVDSALIPRILKLDYAKLLHNNTVYDLTEQPPECLESWSHNGTSTGQPIHLAWYQEKIRLYPVPTDGTYTVRIAAHVKVPAPASDDEADNPWMVKAEKLVRCWAKWELYENDVFDTAKADRFNPANEAGPTAEAFRTLRDRTNNLTQQGGWRVRPVRF